MKKYYGFLLGVVIGAIAAIVITNIPFVKFGGVKCLDGARPDVHGCCAGETYTDMGQPYDDSGLTFACCPSGDGDCFPPLK